MVPHAMDEVEAFSSDVRSNICPVPQRVRSLGLFLVP